MSSENIAPLFLFDDEPPTRDVPEVATVGGDALHLGAEEWAQTIASCVLGARGPFGIGLYGSWGHGKTSFIQRVRTLVEANAGEINVQVDAINAWMLEQIDLLPDRLKHVESEPEIESRRARSRKWRRNVGLGLGLGTALYNVLEPYLPPSDLGEIPQDPPERIPSSAEDDKGDTRHVLFFDDLDRVHPDQAHQILQIIKTLLWKPNYVFVLALDPEVIVHYLNRVYREEYGYQEVEGARPIGERYLEKIIQFEFRLPGYDPERIGTYYDALMDQAKDGGLDAELLEPLRAIKGVLAPSYGYNPRALKRALNRLIVQFDLFARANESSTVEDSMELALVEALAGRLGAYETGKLLGDSARCREVWTELQSQPEEPKWLLRLEPDLPGLLRMHGVRLMTDEKVRAAKRSFVARARPTAFKIPEDQRTIVDRAMRTDLRRQGIGIADDAAITPELRELVRQLSLEGTAVTDAGLAAIAGLTGLQALSLYGTKVSNAGLASLAGLTALETLWLSRTQVRDAGLASQAGLTELQRLYLIGTQVTDVGLASLAGLTGLQSLDLSGTKVADAGLASLAGLTGLLRLDLSGTQVTDAGLASMAGWAGLQTLGLYGTQVTGAGVKAFHADRMRLGLGAVDIQR